MQDSFTFLSLKENKGKHMQKTFSKFPLKTYWQCKSSQQIQLKTVLLFY